MPAFGSFSAGVRLMEQSVPTVYGYVLGGDAIVTTSNYVATADRITFSTGTAAAHTPANLSQARELAAGISDCSTYGYISGGTSGVSVATTDRVTFSTSTTAAQTASNLPATPASVGLSDGAVYGYAVDTETSAAQSSYQLKFATGIYAFKEDIVDIAPVLYYTTISDGAIYGYFIGGEVNWVGPPV